MGLYVPLLGRTQRGDRIDRYGPPTGRYVSPLGVPSEQRSLPPSRIGDTLTEYVVFKPIPGAQGSIVAPAHGQRGGGVQIVLPDRLQYLIKNDILGEIER
ncbi:TNT domain-containing protein [Monaibacterium marinum]|uniref:TNT domain-containing protein n=1 Tax=Pontivivens marinum TaxID=1690039 RepID=UPI000BF0A357